MPIVTAVHSYPIPDDIAIDVQPASLPEDSTSSFVIVAQCTKAGVPVPNRRLVATNNNPGDYVVGADNPISATDHVFLVSPPFVEGTYTGGVTLTDPDV